MNIINFFTNLDDACYLAVIIVSLAFYFEYKIYKIKQAISIMCDTEQRIVDKIKEHVDCDNNNTNSFEKNYTEVVRILNNHTIRLNNLECKVDSVIK